MNASSLLQIRNLEAGYAGQRVLRGVSLDLGKGQLVTLIGPNGHGKSTLLKCLSGLVRPTAGEVRLNNQVLSGRKAHQIVAAGVVHIPQGDMIFPDMSVLDNLMMGAYLASARKGAAERLEGVFDLLPRLRERSVQIASTLSGGERRMLAIGRGLMSDGSILLIDEPSLGLAPLVIDQIYEVIAGLRKRGTSILLVEENASRVVGLADRVHLLDDGKIVWQGLPEEMVANKDILSTYLGG